MLLSVLAISVSVSANPFGMYNILCLNALKMAPLCEMHATSKDKCNHIQAAFASENEDSLHSSLKSKTIPGDDLECDLLRRYADN